MLVVVASLCGAIATLFLWESFMRDLFENGYVFAALGLAAVGIVYLIVHSIARNAFAALRIVSKDDSRRMTYFLHDWRSLWAPQDGKAESR